MVTRRAFLPAVCCFVLLSVAAMPEAVWAQRDAGAKARGDFTFYARSGGSHINAAHAHASHYHQYLSQSQTASPRIVRMSGSAINHHIDLTQQHLEGMRDHFTETGDKKSLAAVDTIEQHLAQAVEENLEIRDYEWFTEEEAAAMELAFNELGDDRLAPVREHLNQSVTYLQLNIYRAMRHKTPQ